MFHSGFTEEHLVPGHQMLIEKLVEDEFMTQHVCAKYSRKKFLKASVYAVEWARTHLHLELPPTSAAVIEAEMECCE